MSVDTAVIRRHLDWGLVAPDRLGYVPVNAEAVRDDVTALCDEVDQLRAVLARVRELCEEPCTFCADSIAAHNRYEVRTSSVLAVLDGEAAPDRGA